MLRLLSANLKRLLKDKVWWVVAVCMAFEALLYIVFALSAPNGAIETKIDYIFFGVFGLAGFAVPGIAMAIVCSTFVGRDFSNGTIRNKIIVGHKRSNIYLANFLTCAAMGIGLNIIFFVLSLIIGLPIFGSFTLDTNIILWSLCISFLIMISYAAIMNLITMLLRNITAAAIINLIGVIVFMFVFMMLFNKLNEPLFWNELIDGEYIKIPNPGAWSEEVKRIFRVIMDIFPTGQSVQMASGVQLDLGMEPHLWQMCLYSGVLTVILNVIGAAVFKKLDLK